MSSGSSSLSGSGFDVMKIKEQTDAYGNLTGMIIEGMDSAGNKIRQTVKDGELLSTTFEKIGEDAKIWAQIESEQKAAQKAQSELWKQIISEEKQAKAEESAIMKSLIAEQEAYVKALQDREAAEIAAVEARNRRDTESSYKRLFDEINQRDEIHRQALIDQANEEEILKKSRQEAANAVEEQIKRETEALKERNRVQAEREYAELFDQVGLDQYLESLSKQISLTEQLYEAQKREVNKPGSSTTEIENIQRQLIAEQNITKELIKQNPALKSNEKAVLYLEQLAKKRKDGENEVTQALKDQQQKYNEQATISDQVLRSITHILTSAVSNALSSFWRNAQEYAKGYYDQLNEIRIVTGKTEEDANRMGQTYREMAQSMSVSSSEIANAAVEFWRQGLNESEVNSRLTSTIQYAKISSLEFKDAAEQMTAATNGMGISASHVADVWAYLGDASASGADEIGTAMQKVAATAGEAGLSFEWLGAYIATISEKTRQAPEVIGTSLNSIISRIQSIKEKGYNEEDDTKINDIAKALSNIDVALMNNQGNWRDLNDIFMDIALQWNDLDDKTRSYIATTVAGTRQKNHFLTLMDDLKNVSGTTGEASRAMELYEGALASTGTASEKYAIYQESVAAAHDKMTASLERLYSLLDSEIIKDFYNSVGDLSTLFYVMFGGTIERDNYGGVVSTLQSQIDVIKPLIDEYSSLNDIQNRTDSQNQRMNEIIKTLSSEYQPFNLAQKDSTGNFLSGEEALDAMNKELAYTIELLKRYSNMNIEDKISDLTGLSTAKSNYDSAKANQRIVDIIQNAASILGYDINTMEAEDFNGLAQMINTYRDFSLFGGDKDIYNLFRPNGKKDKELWDAWDSFFKKYQARILEGYNTMTTLTLDDAEAGQAEAVATKVNEYLELFANSDEYSKLPSAFQEGLSELAGAIADSIIQADWDQGAEFVNQKISDYANNAWESYQQMIKEMQYYFSDANVADPSDPVQMEALAAQRADVQKTIDVFNDLYGTDYTFDDILSSLFEPVQMIDETIKNSEKRMSRLQSLADDVWANINAKNQSDKIAGFSADGWSKQLSLMERALNEALKGNGSGWAESIMAAWLGNEDMLTAMMDDLDWFDDFALAMKDGNFTEAMQIMQDGMDKTKEKAESLGEALKNSIASQELEALTESGFVSWFEEMSKFAESGDEAGLFGWLLGKDDAQLNAFIEAFPIFSEFLNSIVEGKGIVEESAESWSLFSENIGNATDKYLAWLEVYRAGQEDEITSSEGRGLLKSLTDAYDKGGIREYKKTFESMTDAQRNWIVKNSEAGKEMVEIIEDSTDATKDSTSAMKKLNREIGRMDLDSLVDAGDVWEDIPDMIDAAAKGGKDFSESYSNAVGEVEKLSEAQGALAAIQSGTLQNTKDLEEAYSTLASYTGLSADSLKNDLSPALWMINNDTALASNSVAYLANWLANAAGVQFTAANWQSQLSALMNSADETTAHVATLVNAMLKAAGSSLYMSGNTVKVKWGGGSFTPSSARSGGGSGSGGSSTSNDMSEIEKMLDLMEQIQDIRDHQMDLIQEARNYYDTTGELQGVIKYYEKERAAILDNNSVIEDNIAKIESLMFAKQKEVESMSTSDDAYEQAAKDLEGLQSAHQEYTQQLLENKTAVEELTQSIKDQQDKIRDMEIELRDTILDAIKDREELNERMLQGTIDVENEILDIIKSRYEKERDEITKTAEARRDALEEEKDLLDKQLEARKNAAEQEDKRIKLAELQAKLQRISADPTRKKEELELRKQIAELRDEMAWDLAEQEVEAQKDSIDQQIDSLDEYIEYVENYYEELFNHPQKQIEEMKSIISKTDEEILEFLRQNSEDYAASTEATQQSMINSWNEMLMDMHGSIEDYWDEVEQIIAGGDDAIIEFLKQNSADYKEAGKLQAEAYVDEWKKQLDDLRKAHKEITEEINNTTYTVVKPSTGSGSSSGSSGSSGGSSSPKYKLVINGSYTVGEKFSSYDAAYSYYKENYQSTDKYYITQYAKGGLANFTGPAWLDGTKMKPERILSPYQTELFEDMISTLHNIKVNASSMPTIGFDNTNGGNNFTFGDIIINVDKLDDESDYRDVAQEIMDQIMDLSTRGSSVGGIRITR